MSLTKIAKWMLSFSVAEIPIKQSDMGLDAVASTTGDAVRWDEFSLKHNNDGSFKGIDQSDLNLSSQATATKKAVRWDEFKKRHNNDGTIKQLNYKKSSVANPSATANTDGTVVDLVPPTDYTAINLLFFDVVFGGTFVSSESVTANITVTYNDATTATLTRVATTTSVVSLKGTDLMSLIKDGAYINKISVKSQSTMASSTVTVTFNQAGFYL